MIRLYQTTRWAICFVANSNAYNSYKYLPISIIFHRCVQNRHENMPTEFQKDWSFGFEDIALWIWATKNDVAKLGICLQQHYQCTQLVFIEPGVKINGTYYRDVLLTQHLLPAIQEIFGDFFIFQQDSAPAHRYKEIVQFLSDATPDFIKPVLGPPNSPDLNPVDYKVWRVLQERVYQTRIRDVNHLKQRLAEELSRSNRALSIMRWRSGVFA